MKPSVTEICPHTSTSPESMPTEITTKTLSDLEAENGITEVVCDLSARYLGLPPSKRFYKNGETEFSEMRSKFDAALKRLGISNVD